MYVLCKNRTNQRRQSNTGNKGYSEIAGLAALDAIGLNTWGWRKQKREGRLKTMVPE